MGLDVVCVAAGGYERMALFFLRTLYGGNSLSRGLRPTSAAASVAWEAQQQQQQPQQPQQHEVSIPPPPPELPSAFEALLAEMWGADPNARPSAALVAARLRALQAAMD